MLNTVLPTSPLASYPCHDASCTIPLSDLCGDGVTAGTAEGPVVVWDFVTKGVAKSYHGHTDAVTAVAWSRDGRHIASGGRDQSVILWDVLSGEVVSAGGVECFAVSRISPTFPTEVQGMQ